MQNSVPGGQGGGDAVWRASQPVDTSCPLNFTPAALPENTGAYVVATMPCKWESARGCAFRKQHQKARSGLPQAPIPFEKLGPRQDALYYAKKRH